MRDWGWMTDLTTYVTKLEGTRVVRDNKAKELDIDDLSPLGKHCLESEFR